jgi:hypothetical protein
MATKTKTEFLLITLFSLLLYIPFLSIQYDTNGIIEATGVESGDLLNKNHMLYRPLGLLIWRALQFPGYGGKSLLILQILTAVAGALGVGFAYLAFRSLTPSRAYAAVAALALGTSYSYWTSSTDVFYIPLAGMFAAAALACLLLARSSGGLIAAGILTGLSIATWEGSVFLIPALLLVSPRDRWKPFAGTAILFSALLYIAVAFGTHGVMGPMSFWRWLTSYREGTTLSIWGTWHASRIPIAAGAALDSMVPATLGASLRELLKPVQLGRIAVDIAVVVFLSFLALAIARSRSQGLRFLAAYLCFWPFIIWWDPGTHKWFLVANLFLVAFILLGLAEWRSRKIFSLAFAMGVFVIAATHFITTIRPLHFKLGTARPIAACVAEHMQPQDLFVAAEWGWPDYLGYFHHRAASNLLNLTAHFGNKNDAIEDVRLEMATARKAGGQIYFADPRHYPASHLAWLQDSTGIVLDDLLAFGGSPAFMCNDVPIQRL